MANKNNPPPKNSNKVEIRNPGEISLDPVQQRIAQIVVQQVSNTLSIRQGPLPSPADFAAYEKAVPGSGDRILRMAEETLAHRRKMEENSLEIAGEETRGELVITLRGQMFGFSAIVLLVLGAIACFYFRAEAAAYSQIVLAIAAVCGHLYYKGRERKEQPASVPAPKE